MKIGFCTNMSPQRPDGTGLESLDKIVDAGFDYVELPAAQIMGLEAAALDEAVARLKRTGLPVLAMNNLFPAHIRVTGPDADPGRIDAYVDRLLAVGRTLGVETMVFGSSGARNVPMRFSRDEAWKQIVDMLSRLGPKAEKHGVAIAIEHINHLECNIVDWFAEGVKLCRELDIPSVRCLVDSFHLDLGNEPLALVEENFSLVRHVHFSNVLNRTVPTPDLHEPRGLEFLALLKKLHYPYKISIEGHSKDLDSDIPGSCRFLRDNLA